MNKIIKIDTNIYWLPEELFTDDVLYDNLVVVFQENMV